MATDTPDRDAAATDPPGSTEEDAMRKATSALILGVLGITLVPVLCSIFALVFGYQARRRIDAHPGWGGIGSALAAIILGWIGVGLGAIGVVALLLGVKV